MAEKLLSKQLYVKKSPIHGFGVFAAQGIEKNEIIEECHMLKIKNNNIDLVDYCFRDDAYSILPLGYGAIYNHASLPNASFAVDKERSLLTITANKTIKKGEEIFISYGNEWFSSRQLVAKEPSLKFKLLQYKEFALFFMRFAVVAGFLFSMLVLLNGHPF